MFFSMNERRRERLASFVKAELAKFFKDELELPSEVLVSILSVTVSEGGGRASAVLSIYPSAQFEGVAKVIKKGENGATRYIRGRLASKYSPTIHFVVIENNTATNSAAW